MRWLITTCALVGVWVGSVREGNAESQAPRLPARQAKHASQLLEQPGVVSVGLGRDDSGNPAIIVGLEAPRPETEAALPHSLDGYPVITRVVGPVRAR